MARRGTPAPLATVAPDLFAQPEIDAVAELLQRRGMSAWAKAATLWRWATWPVQYLHLRDGPEVPPRDLLRHLTWLQQSELEATRRDEALTGRPQRPTNLTPWIRKAERLAASMPEPPQRLVSPLHSPSVQLLETSSTQACPLESTKLTQLINTKEPSTISRKEAVRVKKLRTGKIKAIRVTDIFNEGTDPDLIKRADRICTCASKYALKVHKPTAEIRGRIVFRCRDRFCPTCSYFRAREVRSLVRVATENLLGVWEDARFAMLTLTTRNVPVTELGAAEVAMRKAFKRMTERKAWPAFGYFAAFETTRGKDGSAHPHLHVLLVLHPAYFSDRTADASYLTWDDWKELWREAMNVDYSPVVDIRAIKPSRNTIRRLRGMRLTAELLRAEAVMDAVAELAKYPIKLDDSMLEDGEWFREAVRQLKDVRAWSVGGIYTPTVRAARKAREKEKAERRKERDAGCVLLWFFWNDVDYVRARPDDERTWSGLYYAQINGSRGPP